MEVVSLCLRSVIHCSLAKAAVTDLFLRLECLNKFGKVAFSGAVPIQGHVQNPAL